MSDSEDDVPTLPADTLAVLQSFLKEQTEQKQREEAAAETGDVSGINLQEDWVYCLMNIH